MKNKILLALTILFTSQISQATLCWDFEDKKFFTHPDQNDINPVEYDQYAKELSLYVIMLIKKHSCSRDYAFYMGKIQSERKLQYINTTTAHAFLYDISNIKSSYEFLMNTGWSDWC